MLKNNERAYIDRLVLISRLFYELNMTQEEIAKTIGISRSYVAKLIKKAREENLVEIRIKHPLKERYDIEDYLIEKFSLKNCIVIDVDDKNDELLKRVLVAEGINLLLSLVEDGDIIGISWGSTLYQIIPYLELVPVKIDKKVKVVQLNGGVSKSGITTHADEIVREVAKIFSAEYFLLPLPAIVENETTRETLINDNIIKEYLSIAEVSTIAIFSVGRLGFQSILYLAGYITDKEMEEMQKRGVVGDICSTFFDITGNTENIPVNKRVCGINITNLRKKKASIAIAGSPIKAEAILGGLRGGYINYLITDFKTALRIKELNEKLSILDTIK
ncbi:MAG: sugar-binding transcriptional regulator [Dictyoglomaceae bacterium]